MKLKSSISILVLILLVESTLIALSFQFPLGDTTLIVDAGSRILRGIYPYTNYDYGNFASAGIVFYAISLVTGIQILSKLVFVWNMIGIIAFLYALSKLAKRRMSWLIIALPLTVSFRSLVANGQITGIVLLLVSVPLLLRTSSRFFLPLSLVSLTLACELKPHMALPFCLVAAIISKRAIIIPLLISTILSLHLIVGILFGFELDIRWLNSARQRSSRSLDPGAEFSLWKLLNYFFATPRILIVASLLVFAVAILLILKNWNNPVQATAVAVISPLLLGYQHPYDWIPFLIWLLAFWKIGVSWKPIWLLTVLSNVSGILDNASNDFYLSLFSLFLLLFGGRLLLNLREIENSAPNQKING
jgi:hypothetical protein